jgi:uncharacterized protein YecT (DUF1311 family)
MKFFAIILLITFNAQAYAGATGYKYKQPEDFHGLSSYCLNNTGGGTGGIPCFIGAQLWDRELNDIYRKLIPLLTKDEVTALKESQRAWIKERDLSIALHSMILDREYSDEGTMYRLIRAGQVEDMIQPIIKQRALVLMRWYDLVK